MYTAAMASSYKALRGRIHALNDTATPTHGPKGYNRYGAAPLPLVIGSSSFAADETAGLSAPIRNRAPEEDQWQSDEEDDLPLPRRRNNDDDATQAAHQAQNPAAAAASEQARLEALLDDPLFSSSLPQPLQQEGDAASALNGSAPAPAAAPAARGQVAAPAAGLLGGEEDGEAFGGGFFGSVARRNPTSLFGGGGDLGFGGGGGLFGGEGASLFGGGGVSSLFARTGGESLFGESVPPAPAPAAPAAPAAPTAPVAAQAQAAAPSMQQPASPAVGGGGGLPEDDWVDVASAPPTAVAAAAPQPPAPAPAPAERKPGRCTPVLLVRACGAHVYACVRVRGFARFPSLVSVM